MADIGLVGYLAWAGLGIVGCWRLLRSVQYWRRALRGPARVSATAHVVVYVGGGILWAAAPFGPPLWLVYSAMTLAALAMVGIAVAQFLLRLPDA